MIHIEDHIQHLFDIQALRASEKDYESSLHRDVDEHVRKAAFKFIAEKIHIKSLTIAQREQILQRGLSDR